jgi:hypothetical protein
MNIYNNGSLQKHTMLFKQTQQNILNTRSNDFGELLNSNTNLLAERQKQNDILDKIKQNLEQDIQRLNKLRNDLQEEVTALKKSKNEVIKETKINKHTERFKFGTNA